MRIAALLMLGALSLPVVLPAAPQTGSEQQTGKKPKKAKKPRKGKRTKENLPK
jgi:hypothetical protein